jgi:hypothetical protein
LGYDLQVSLQVLQDLGLRSPRIAPQQLIQSLQLVRDPRRVHSGLAELRGFLAGRLFATETLERHFNRPQLSSNGRRVTPRRKEAHEVRGVSVKALNRVGEISRSGVVSLEGGFDLRVDHAGERVDHGAVIASRNFASNASSRRSRRYAVPCAQTTGPFVLANAQR